MTVDRLPDSPAGRPLAAGIGATQGAVGEVQDVDEPEVGYRAIARLSGHLATMWRTVYPHADGHVGTDGQLRAVCLSRAREVEWALRLLQCQLSGDVSAAGRRPPPCWSRWRSASTATGRPSGCWSPGWRTSWAPRAGNGWPGKYRRALTHAPTRPHPRCPRTGPLRHVAFWLHGRWDRLLDTMDSRPGVGIGFPVPSPNGGPAPAADEGEPMPGSAADR